MSYPTVLGLGRCAWMEVKRRKGWQSDAQVAFEGHVRANEGEYHVWRSEVEALAWAEGVRRGAA